MYCGWQVVEARILRKSKQKKNRSLEREMNQPRKWRIKLRESLERAVSIKVFICFTVTFRRERI